MNLFRSIARQERRSDAPLSFDQWTEFFNFGGFGYPILNQSISNNREEIEASFPGYVQAAYKRNGIVFACMLVRLQLFSEARFQFRRMRNGRPGDLFGTSDLRLLERPWQNATTGDLLSRMIQDADLAGNFYATRRPPRKPGGSPRIERLRPDWVTIVRGSEGKDGLLGSELVGYVYKPGGPASGIDAVALLPEEVAHFAPIPDPIAQFRGMSWLTPVVREITADGAATTHKEKFFENGATPNLVVSLGDVDLNPKTFQEWVDKMEGEHAGLLNAYKTLYLAAGADAKVVGSDLKQVDFKAVQGAGETRIAAAAGVPPVIVGLSEGLQAATYSNYSQARRRFADGTMRPLWRNAAGSLATLLDSPSDAELWYDDRDIPFLQEDLKDRADIQQTQAITIRQLVDGGFTEQTVIDAVLNEDWSRLKHSGLLSVQLQEPGSNTDAPALSAGPNGNGASAPAAS